MVSMGEKDYPQEVILFSIFLIVCSGIASSQSTIRSLPGFNGALPFELETGYVSVDEANDVQLFYYFVKSERNPREDPLILWIDGGPGCSSFCGLAFEIGPLNFKISEHDGTLPSLVLAPYSWTKVSNIIFLDSPVGTGYSYSRTSQGFQTGDTKSAEQTYTFLGKWLIDHPDFLQNPLYIAGLSYSGIAIPIIAQEISDGNEAGNEPFINLKGYLLGNPATDRHAELNSIVPFAHGMRLISDELYELVKKHCNGEYANVNPSNTQCLDGLQSVNKCIAHLNAYHILESHCPTEAIEPKGLKRGRISNENYSEGLVSSTMPPYPGLEYMSTMVDCDGECMKVDHGDRPSTEESHSSNVILKPKGMERGRYVEEYSGEVPPSPPLPSNPVLECRAYVYKLAYYWANDEIVQRALNIQEGTVGEWIRCKLDIPYKKQFNNTVKYHKTLSARGYRILIFSGDHDTRVPSFASEAWMKSLNFPVIDEWRPWYINGQISGYTRSYANNMTFATVKGGGHEVPMYKPKECYAMFKRWISHNPL